MHGTQPTIPEKSSMKPHRSTLVAILAATSLAGLAQAQEKSPEKPDSPPKSPKPEAREEGHGLRPDVPVEVREKMERRHQEIRKLMAEGKEEEARKLMEQTRSEFGKAHGGPGQGPRLGEGGPGFGPHGGPSPGHLKEMKEKFAPALKEIEELRAAGKHEEASKLMAKVRAEAGDSAPKKTGEPREPEKKSPQKPAGSPKGEPGASGPGKMAEMRKKMDAHREEIRDLMREGKHQEARKRIQELRGEFGMHRGGPRMPGRGFGPHIGKDSKGRPEGHRPGPHAPGRPHHPEPRPDGPGPDQKIAHLREAAEHLQAAGLSEEAGHFRARAEEMARHHERQDTPNRHEGGPGGDSLERRLDAMEGSIRSLREQLEAMGRRLENRN